jgi:cytochrome oxidase assembly protein ShyY1
VPDELRLPHRTAAGTVRNGMYRFLFRPKWLLFHLGVLLLVVLMVNLGLWQLRRLDQRKDFNAEVRSHETAPERPVGEVLPVGTTPDAKSLQWYQVTATGTYLTDRQVLVVNVSQDGAPGVDPVVPLQLDDGRLLLVNRGFVVNGMDVPPPPSGEVTIVGRLRPSQKRATGALSDPADGVLTEVHRVDINRLQMQLDAPVLPMYVDLLRSDPPEPSDVIVPVAAPELTNGPHLGYAVQWAIFSLAVIVGWVLAVRRSIRKHREDLADAEAAAAEPALEST